MTTIATAYGKVRSKGDWLLYLLLLAAVMCLPLVVETSRWVPEANRLIYVAFWGSLVGVVLARSALPDWLAWVYGVTLGLEYSITFAGKLLPVWRQLLGDLGRVFPWLWHLLVGGTVNADVPGMRIPDVPFAETSVFVATRAKAMLASLTAWWQAVQSGANRVEAPVLKDNTALWLGVALVIWLLAWNAGFELFRRRRTFAAFLPLGVAVVANVSFTYIGMAYVHIYLGATLAALVWANIGRIENIWVRLGLDFSAEVRRDAAVAGFGISTLIFLAALVTPYVTYDRTVWAFWNRYGPRFKTFYDELDRAFAGRNPVPEPTPGPKGPVGHTLSGGSSPLSQKTVFYVETSDPPPPSPEEVEQFGSYGEVLFELVPKRYWREVTYDAYTGHGWDNSERNMVSLEAGKPWAKNDVPHIVLTQTVHLVAGRRELGFAVNELTQAEKPYRTSVRGEGDLSAFYITGDTYTVISRVPDVTVEELRTAEEEYPAWVKEHFLQLPKIPARVQQAAEDAMRQAETEPKTRYDKALAIERYLRTFTYKLDIEPPPLDRDVVDYFLFDTKQGYCDYSATAMVVLLRSMGIAARYASGYAMGEWSESQRAWVVSERDAHAWAEVYFPGYGWVEFEPTPSQQVFVRASSRSSSLDLSDLTATQQTTRSVPTLWLGAGALALVLLFVVIWPPRWFRRGPQEPRHVVWGVYESLVRRARWLGLAPFGGQTPKEYLNAFAAAVERRATFAVGAGRDVGVIEHAYERARYSVEPISVQDGDRVASAWRRLRSILWRLMFVRVSRDRPAS